jgi:formate dehydrogenase major subunit
MRGERSRAHGALQGRQGQPRPSCVKGRFAWGYATHKDRILKPMIREKITDPWREVSWDEAIGVCAVRVQAHPGEVRPGSVGGITSSRCTNEETYLVQKLIRAGSATTTSTPAPASAIRRPAMA